MTQARHESAWWLRHPSPKRAVMWVLGLGAVAALVAVGWSRESPTALRSTLPFEHVGAPDVYLTSGLDEPGRMLLTRKRGLSSLQRSDQALAGARYWVHRYRDPQRPGLPERRLLTSRRRGARLYVPVGAVDLERALSKVTAFAEDAPGIASQFVYLYEDRAFQGLFLELRFPKRELDAKKQPIRFDIVAVRDGEVRTVDWVLKPYDRYYRAMIAAGRFPSEPARFDRDTPTEAVLMLYEDPKRAPAPLWSPVPLFRELGLAWGGSASTIHDDRWVSHRREPIAVRAPSRDDRRRLVELASLHLLARFDGEREGAELNRRLSALEAR